MAGVFTQLVRVLPEHPGTELFDAAWSSLGELLKNELRQRGLWQAPPSYLGIFGWQSWTPPGEDRRGPLDELVAECFSFNFVDRQRSLRVQLRTKPSIDGLVLLNVRHFLYERQRRHDPLGFRVFEIAREGVEEALRRGLLQMDEGAGRVANPTVLRLGAGLVEIAGREQLAEVVCRWNDALLPDLLVVAGRQRAGVVEHLLTLLAELPALGVGSFRFKDLVDPLKTDARLRWAGLLAQSQGGPGRRMGAAVAQASELEASVQPDPGLEELDRFLWLSRTVAASIAGLESDPRQRDYLSRLWGFLAPSEAGTAATRNQRVWVDERLPSHRRLGRELGIPRERVPGLLQKLGELLNRARTEDARHAVVGES